MTIQIARPWATLLSVGPGFLASVIVAGIAGLVATYTAGPVMLLALLLGIAVNFLGGRAAFDMGISFTSTVVLRLGIALLGLKITLGEVASLGWSPLVLVLCAVALTILISTLAARWMGFDPRFGVLSGGATAICGASAAMALSAAMPSHPLKERATLFTVVVVSTLSTIAMLLYPVIARAMGLDNLHSGIFIGATIHDVAQVVGAGFAVSIETGKIATIVKLSRVAMLLPVILIVGFATRKTDDPAGERPRLLPWFAVAFASLVAVNSLLPIAHWIQDTGNAASRFFLVSAIAALGMKTRVADILAFGWKPVILLVAETAFIASIALVAIAAHLV